MNKIKSFSVRNAKEILRDPLSYIFCLAFPLVMLVVMSLINESIPPESGVTTFRIDNLAGGIAVFGLTFVMLFSCLTVAKDRSGAFLTRLYATPMTSGSFVAGYLVPVMVIALAQLVITFAAAFVVSLIGDVEMNVLGMLLAVAALIPSVVIMSSFGVLFGSLFNEKAAPGLCSIVISLSSFLGGIFFDPDSTGGILLKICKALPFYHSVKCARMACAMEFESFWGHLGITAAWAAIIIAAAALAFSKKMKADLS